LRTKIPFVKIMFGFVKKNLFLLELSMVYQPESKNIFPCTHYLAFKKKIVKLTKLKIIAFDEFKQTFPSCSN
jgi:hypothetical protein